MSKVILLGDTHFGVKNDSRIILDFQRDFFDQVLFPFCKENNIKEIWQLGDLFDNRKSIHMPSLQAAREIFLDPLSHLCKKVTFLVGNHDAPYRNTLESNSVELLVEQYPWDNNIEIDVIKRPKERGNITFFPWICQDNYEDSMAFMKRGNAIAVGHFEISNVLHQYGIESKKGLQISDFSKFKKVFSGHFHERSLNQNILYVGVPYEMYENESHAVKGFHVFDTEDFSCEFIPNPLKLYSTLEWPNNNINAKDITNKYVTINVLSGYDTPEYNHFIDEIIDHKPYNLTIKHDIVSAKDIALCLENVNANTSEKLMEDCYEKAVANTSIEKDFLKGLFDDLYNEALKME